MCQIFGIWKNLEKYPGFLTGQIWKFWKIQNFWINYSATLLFKTH